MRVKYPEKDDWGKLKRVIKCIKGTLGVNMNLIEYRLSVIKWWVYASFSTHINCRGYTGGIVSLG